MKVLGFVHLWAVGDCVFRLAECLKPHLGHETKFENEQWVRIAVGVVVLCWCPGTPQVFLKNLRVRFREEWFIFEFALSLNLCVRGTSSDYQCYCCRFQCLQVLHNKSVGILTWMFGVECLTSYCVVLVCADDTA